MRLGLKTIQANASSTVSFLTSSRFKTSSVPAYFVSYYFPYARLTKKNQPMIDILNLLEKLEIISSVAVMGLTQRNS
jgi:hypothetical protein